MRDDLFEDVAHDEIVAIALVVVDVASSQGRLIEMPHQNFFFVRQLLEAIGIQLHDSRVVYLLETVRSIGLLRGCRGWCRQFSVAPLTANRTCSALDHPLEGDLDLFAMLRNMDCPTKGRLDAALQCLLSAQFPMYQ